MMEAGALRDMLTDGVISGVGSVLIFLPNIMILYLFIFYYKAPVFYMTLALITSTALGMLPHYIGIGKSHLMGVLIIPAIVIYIQMFI